MDRISLLLKMLSTVRTWWTYIAHMLGRVKSDRVAYRLRNGMTIILRTHSSDRNVFNDIWLEHVYAHPEIEWEKCKTIIDIGAHIGLFTCYAAARSPQASMYAFEPEPSNADLLEENIRINGLSGRVRVERKGAAGKDGTLTLNVIPGRGEANSAYRQGENSYGIAVPVISLEHIFSLGNIGHCNLLKVNCEGEEYDLLYMLPPHFFQWIDAMLINYHLFSPNPEHHPQKLIPFLERQGYTVTKHPHEILFVRRAS